MILGKKINMRQHQTAAIKHRLQKAKETRRQTKRKLFQNKTIPQKLRIQLWNALVRSTLKYALQTQEITHAQKETINRFAQKCMRGIIDNTWYTTRKEQPDIKFNSIRTRKVYLRTEQPTITSWMEKQSTIHMARQTKLHRKIHPQTMNRTQYIQDRWIQTWKQVKEELTRPQTKTTKNLNTNIIQTTPLIYKIPNKENEQIKKMIIKQQEPPRPTQTPGNGTKNNNQYHHPNKRKPETGGGKTKTNYTLSPHANT